METSILHEFIVLEETNSFSRAARQLNISQATLSRHIQQLESEYQITLFERTTQKMTLTPYGELFLRHAREILASEQHFRRAADKLRQRDCGHLVIGTVGFPYYYGITRLFAEFKKAHPEATLEVKMASNDELVSLLNHREVDLAFIRNTMNIVDDYQAFLFAEDLMHIAVPFNHPLADLKTAHLGLFRNDTFYFHFRNDSLMGQFVASIFRDAGFIPHVSGSQGSWEDSVINDSRAITLCMGGLAETFGRNVHVKVLTLQPRIHADIYLAALPEPAPSGIAASFINFAKEHAAAYSDIPSKI